MSWKPEVPKFRALSTDELIIVRDFARAYGRDWKQYLQAAWLSYSYKGIHMGEQDTGTLRCLRNELGHEWLRQFKLPRQDRVEYVGSLTPGLNGQKGTVEGRTRNGWLIVAFDGGEQANCASASLRSI
jgi:hypothetical protein